MGTKLAVTDAPKLHRRMARAKFDKILRLMRYVKAQHLQAVFVCPACQQPATLKRGQGLLITAGTGGPIDPKRDTFSVVCGCTVWTVNA